MAPVAKDLISRLLCDAEHRIGSHGGAAEIKVRPGTSCSPGGGRAVRLMAGPVWLQGSVFGCITAWYRNSFRLHWRCTLIYGGNGGW